MSGLPARSPELRGLRILLVEDEFLVALELESMLQELGGEVIGPLGSLDQAVAVAREEALDVAVLDVNVGGRLVTPVADALAARTIPFVFCTGYDAASLPGRHAAAPMLMKPCQAHELKNALSSALGCPDRSAPAVVAARRTGRKTGRSPTTGAGRARRAGRPPAD
jgi:DNA-binding NarL/FixJ family response regulator